MNVQPLTFGQRAADTIAEVIGSWKFLIGQSIFIAIYMAINVAWLGHLVPWDPYPFILLNLVLSLQAAVTGPVLMISQNRSAEKDRATANETLNINRETLARIKELAKEFEDEFP